MFATILGLAAIVAAGKIEHVIAIGESDDVGHATAAGLVVSLAMAVVIALAVAVVATVLDAGMHPVYWILAPCVIVLAISQIVQAIAIRRGAFTQVARVRLEQSAASVALVVIGGVVQPGVWPLVIAQTAQQSIGALRLIRKAAPELTLQSVWQQRRAGIASLRTYSGLMSAAAASGLINNLAWALPVLLVGFYYGAAQVGLLAMAMRCYTPIRTLVTATGDQIALGEGVRLLSAGDAPALRRQILAMLQLSVLMGLAIVVLTVAAPPVMRAWFPAPWNEASRYVVPLGIVVGMQVAINPLTTLVVLFRQQTRQLRYDVVRAVLVAAILMAFGQASSAPHHAMLAYAAGMAIMYAVYTRFFMNLLTA
jgi:O-antigen/teichoic acid export membrane protein